MPELNPVSPSHRFPSFLGPPPPSSRRFLHWQLVICARVSRVSRPLTVAKGNRTRENAPVNKNFSQLRPKLQPHPNAAFLASFFCFTWRDFAWSGGLRPRSPSPLPRPAANGPEATPEMTTEAVEALAEMNRPDEPTLAVAAAVVVAVAAKGVLIAEHADNRTSSSEAVVGAAVVVVDNTDGDVVAGVGSNKVGLELGEARRSRRCVLRQAAEAKSASPTRRLLLLLFLPLFLCRRQNEKVDDDSVDG
jgi:hypothetical protein